jgi:hypothetical protein
LLFAAFVVTAGALLSFLIPPVDVVPTTADAAESLVLAEAIDAATAGSMAPG